MTTKGETAGRLNQKQLQIPRLPTGISYFVRIKVLGEKNEVLVETPEIRARNEIVSIKCEPGTANRKTSGNRANNNLELSVES